MCVLPCQKQGLKMCINEPGRPKYLIFEENYKSQNNEQILKELFFINKYA